MDQVGEYLRMFRRRFWIVALILIIGLPVVGLYAFLKPPLYQAEAKILVESQRIPDELARSTVTGEAAERLQIIQQRLMARDNLTKLIQDVGLFTDRGDLTMTDKVDLARKATKIVPITVTGQRRRDRMLTAFVIQVTVNDAKKAAKLANEYVTIVLDQNIQARSERARETTTFFIQEQDRLNNEIIALEQKITAFKQENKDALPETMAFRQSELSRLGDERLGVEQTLLQIQEERRAIRDSLEILDLIGTPVAEQSEEARELRRLKSELEQKRGILSDQHPEIRALKNRIAALEALVEEQTPETAEGDPTLGPKKADLNNKLETLEERERLYRARLKDLEREGTTLAQSLQRTPSVEIELDSMARSLDELHTAHAGATRKRAEAEISERLEINQQAERFEVIENAIVPRVPVAPNRKKIIVMGGGAIFALAFGLAFLVDQMRPRVRTAAQLERQLGLRPVVSLPVVLTRRQRIWRWLSRSFLAILILLAIPAGIYALDQYYMPLPLLAERMAEKSGADTLIRMVEQRF